MSSLMICLWSVVQVRYNRDMAKRLAIIDGKSIFYRGYYSMPSLSLPDGTPTGGVYGFTALSIELIKKLKKQINLKK